MTDLLGSFLANEVELGPANFGPANNLYFINHWRMQRKNPLHSYAAYDFTNRECCSGFATVFASQNETLKGLQTDFVFVLFDLLPNAHCVAGTNIQSPTLFSV